MEAWWAIVDARGHLITGAFARRNQAIAFHVYNCGASEKQPKSPWGFQRLDDDQRALWNKRRREGYKVVPVAVRLCSRAA